MQQSGKKKLNKTFKLTLDSNRFSCRTCPSVRRTEVASQAARAGTERRGATDRRDSEACRKCRWQRKSNASKRTMRSRQERTRRYSSLTRNLKNAKRRSVSGTRFDDATADRTHSSRVVAGLGRIKDPTAHVPRPLLLSLSLRRHQGARVKSMKNRGEQDGHALTRLYIQRETPACKRESGCTWKSKRTANEHGWLPTLVTFTF